MKLTTPDFIKNAIEIHGDKYDYSKVNYINAQTKVCIICSEHGEFWQTPSKHMAGQGCLECSYITTANKTRKTTEQFIDKSKLIHNNKYDYSKVEYKNAYKKVIIICPKHGEFEQTPHHHLNYHGCPSCNNSILENEIENLLVLNNIEFISQYRAKWLGRQSLDFYLPMYKIAIECQGEQHFQKVYYRSKKWSEEKTQTNFQQIQKRDKIKKDKCSKQHIQLLYYTNKKYDNTDNVITDKQELLEIIKRKDARSKKSEKNFEDIK